MKIPIKVPNLGEDIKQASISNIIKENDSLVCIDEEIIELETEKTNHVLYAPQGGVFKIDVAVGDTVQIGQVIAYIDDTIISGIDEAPPPPIIKEEKKPPQKAPEEKYDLAIIGGGPGGYVAAIRAAQKGLKTICIDEQKFLGGTCLNVGCIPSKTLLHASEEYENVKKFDVEANYEQLMDHKKKVISILGKGIEGLFRKNNIDRIQGTAKIISPNSLKVGRKTIHADNIIIASGSKPIELPFLPFDGEKVISSTEALEIKTPPPRLAVIGGGAIGLEIASIYSRFGSAVTVIEVMDRICPICDSSISSSLQRSLTRKGIIFNLSSKVTDAQINEEIVLTLENDTTIEVDMVLVAVGRRPYSEDFDLEKDDKGFIVVDKKYQTSIPGIYAIGDVIPGPMLAHKASAEAMDVIDVITEKTSPSPNIIPNVIYTTPEAAFVGITEEEADKEKVKIGVSYFRGNSRSRCSGKDDGLVKIIADAKTLKVLGFHIIGPSASELIAIGSLALQLGATAKDLATMTFAHPTLSETIKEAALDIYDKQIHA